MRHNLSDLNSNGEGASGFHRSVIVVGGGHGGLSAAARLKRAGVDDAHWAGLVQSAAPGPDAVRWDHAVQVSYVVFEMAEPGASWRNRYDRLHLHTVKQISALPYWVSLPTRVRAWLCVVVWL